jgi:hypothetical protein
VTLRLLSLAVLVGGAIAGASASVAVGDSDMYWHLANAKQMFVHGLVRADVYSWTAPGAPVPTDQWLGDALLGAGFTLGSWLGVLAARSIAIAVMVGAIALAAFARRPRAPVVALAIALPAIILSRFVWTERPELFGVACFALLVFLLQLPGERPLLATAPLLILWANLHGSFALGVALVLVVSAYGIWREPTMRRAYAVAAAGALLALVATPAGLGSLSTPSTHLLSPPREIQEWSPPDIGTPPGAIWALVLLTTLATAALSGGARARDLVLIVLLAMLSLVAIRHTPLFAIAATPYLADRLPSAIRVVTRRISRDDAPAATQRTPRSAMVATAVAGVVLLTGGIAVAPREPDETQFPAAALASLAPGPGLYAQYDWGGWLIWRAPATPVFIDGRLGLYRDRVLADYTTVLEAGPGWRDVLDRRGVRSLLVRPADPVAVRALELGWPVVSRSPTYVLISVVHR